MVTGFSLSKTYLGLRMLQELYTPEAEHTVSVFGSLSTSCYGNWFLA